jgi:hypothetical protein
MRYDVCLPPSQDSVEKVESDANGVIDVLNVEIKNL